MSNRIANPTNAGVVNKLIDSKVNSVRKELKTLRVLAKATKELTVHKVVPTAVMSNKPGPLPVSGHFTTNGGTILLTAHMSGFRGTVGLISITVSIDGTVRATASHFCNEINSHKAFVPAIVVAQLPAGSHTVTLAAGANVSSDFNDFYTVSVVEFAA